MTLDIVISNSFMKEVSIAYRNQSTDLQSNQCTGFYMIGSTVMKELKEFNQICQVYPNY